jgi:hypothetical protein
LFEGGEGSRLVRSLRELADASLGGRVRGGHGATKHLRARFSARSAGTNRVNSNSGTRDLAGLPLGSPGEPNRLPDGDKNPIQRNGRGRGAHSHGATGF